MLYKPAVTDGGAPVGAIEFTVDFHFEAGTFQTKSRITVPRYVPKYFAEDAILMFDQSGTLLRTTFLIRQERERPDREGSDRGLLELYVQTS